LPAPDAFHLESCQRLVGGGGGCEDGLSADGCQTHESHLQERKRTERERSEESSGRRAARARTADTVGSTHTHKEKERERDRRERGEREEREREEREERERERRVPQAGLETHHSMRAASSASDTKSFTRKRPGRCA
jgi:hypothetical protein